MKRIFGLLVVINTLFLFGKCESQEQSICPDATCANYATQQAAQAAYNDDKECLGELDNDNDGIACEHLPASGGGTGCPTTANCGCSNKNQSSCVSACCQWVVGTGCKCK
ncbi:MAG: hypothetical protein O9262_15710 [Cyclobacteriaceae bacterium]|nr:hypothetical protein [Cyclobacteriaceae bacterium]